MVLLRVEVVVAVVAVLLVVVMEVLLVELAVLVPQFFFRGGLNDPN